MSEIIVFFEKQNPDIPIHVERSNKGNKEYVGKFLHVVDVILFNSYGEVLLQKRARHKSGAGLLHTSIGGHVNMGEQPEFTVIHECLEEIGVPVIVSNDGDFQHYYNRLSLYTDKCALVEHIRDYFDDIPFENPITGDIYQAFDRRYLCFGIYDGPILSVDRDAGGFVYLTLDEILGAMQNKESVFTPVLMHMITNNIDALIDFRNKYCSKLS